MEICSICGSEEFRRTADDVFICSNGHINNDMLILENEFDGFNTQAISQSQQKTKVEKSRTLFGQQEYLMQIDAIQYCLIKYTEQLENHVGFKIMKFVYDLWMCWLIKHDIEEASNESLFGTISIADVFGILWIALQKFELPISFHDLLDLLIPVELPGRFIQILSKNQLKVLKVKFTSNKRKLFRYLSCFDFVNLPSPNIKLYAVYILSSLKLPQNIADLWFDVYKGDYWNLNVNYYRITFDYHVIWSIYTYLCIEMNSPTLSIDISSWLCSSYAHITNCNIQPRNYKLKHFLNAQDNFQIQHQNPLVQIPKKASNEFMNSDKETKNDKFDEYVTEAYAKLNVASGNSIPCKCFNSVYSQLNQFDFEFYLEKLFIYLLCPTFDKADAEIKKAEERYLRYKLRKEFV
eukprot:NODE_5_length_72347_cov_1.339331.p18 type:complete len:407 gc:universal NODE_5_length_72347_cov_1.339331:34831-33611(-)